MFSWVILSVVVYGSPPPCRWMILIMIIMVVVTVWIPSRGRGAPRRSNILLFRENNYDTLGGASSSTGRHDGSSSRSLYHADAGDTNNVINQMLNSPWRTPTKTFSTNTRYDNIYSCHDNNTNTTSCKSPTEESLH